MTQRILGCCAVLLAVCWAGLVVDLLALKVLLAL